MRRFKVFLWFVHHQFVHHQSWLCSHIMLLVSKWTWDIAHQNTVAITVVKYCSQNAILTLLRQFVLLQCLWNRDFIMIFIFPPQKLGVTSKRHRLPPKCILWSKSVSDPHRWAWNQTKNRQNLYMMGITGKSGVIQWSSSFSRVLTGSST